MKAEKPCPVCGAADFWMNYMGKTGERMKETGECYECCHWQIVCGVGAKVVIDGHMYSIGKEPKSAEARWQAAQHKDLGMSGRRFDIEFLDGRKFTTHNLWSNGQIPERFRDRLPNTAKFMGAEKAQVGETTCWNPANERAPAYPAYSESP